MAKFSIPQLVKVIDRISPEHELIGSVIVVLPEGGRFSYWLRFDRNPAGGRFREEQLEATGHGRSVTR